MVDKIEEALNYVPDWAFYLAPVVLFFVLLIVLLVVPKDLRTLLLIALGIYNVITLSIFMIMKMK